MVKDIALDLKLDSIKVIGYDGTQVIQTFIPSLCGIATDRGACRANGRYPSQKIDDP